MFKKNNVFLNENNVEGKPCINREYKSLQLIIWLYLCYDEHEALRSCNTTVYVSKFITWKINTNEEVSVDST